MAVLTLEITTGPEQKEVEIFLDNKKINQHYSVPVTWTDIEILDYVKAKLAQIGYLI